MSWNPRKTWTFLEPVKRQGFPDETLLSVYRDYGVIPKDSRDDNHNRAGMDLSVYQLVEPGNVVMNKMKAWQGSIAVSRYRGIVSPDYMVLRVVREEVSPDFLHFLLRSGHMITEYRRHAYGVRPSQWRLMYPEFRNLLVALPPLPTQRAIADFLDRKTAAIDALIKRKERLLELLAEKRAALIHRAVTKGLDPSVRMKDSGVPGIGRVPAHWQIKPARYLFRESTRKSETGQELSLSVTQDRGVVPSASVSSIVNPAFNNVGHKHCTKGDLILNRLKAHLGVFFRSDYDGLVSPDYTVFRPLRGINSKFYEALYHHPAYIHAFRIRVRGIVEGLWRLYTDDFNAIPALVPPSNEQLEIVDRIESIETAAADVKTALTEQVERLREYRQALITAAVTGQLDIDAAEHQPIPESNEQLGMSGEAR